MRFVDFDYFWPSTDYSLVTNARIVVQSFLIVCSAAGLCGAFGAMASGTCHWVLEVLSHLFWGRGNGRLAAFAHKASPVLERITLRCCQLFATALFGVMLVVSLYVLPSCIAEHDWRGAAAPCFVLGCIGVSAWAVLSGRA